MLSVTVRHVHTNKTNKSIYTSYNNLTEIYEQQNIH